MADKLGTLEFCSALNGDDLDQVKDVLKKFVKTVKKERFEAFSKFADQSPNSANDYRSNSSSDEESDLEPPTKRRNVEKWMLDKMDYKVPFVGTSTHKGSTGMIKHQCWPTGFLEAYLDQSPRAMELIGEEFQKLFMKGARSDLRINFLQAIGEVLTCAIPVNKINSIENRATLKRKEGSIPVEEFDKINPSYRRIISIVMKEHSKLLFTILNDNAFSDSNHKLLFSTLTILRYLVKTSSEIAKEIVRGIEAHVKEGVLQKLASYNSSPKKIKDDADTQESNISKSRAVSLKIQEAFLELAISLLEHNNNTIMSFISSAGTKESKSKAGVLYLGLRACLNQNKTLLGDHKYTCNKFEESYLLSSYHLLKLVRTQICSSAASSSLILVELLRGDSLEKMIHIYCSRNSDKMMVEIKNECSKAITSLLTLKCSPFLVQLHTATSSNKTSILQQMNKALQYLQALKPSLETRQFISACFNTTPALFPTWLRSLAVPEPKASFACLSKYSLISFVLQNGPDVVIRDGNRIEEGDEKIAYDFIVGNIIPRALTKNILTKAIQSPNPFMTAEALKLLLAILGRFEKLKKDAFSSGDVNERIFRHLAKKLALRIPDLQVILSIRSKFDLNVDVQNIENRLYVHHNFVTFNLCKTLKMYAYLFPEAFRNVKFDWIKLLSDSSKTFLLTPLSLQHCLLDTMASIQICMERAHTNSIFSVNAFLIFAEILLQTKDVTIFELARGLVLRTVGCIIDSSPLETEGCSICSDYEISLWVDCITEVTAPTLGKLLEATQKVTFQHTFAVSNAWSTLFPAEKLPRIAFTPLLSLALVSIASDNDSISESFVSLTRDICTKLLFFQPDKRVLASLVKTLFHNVHQNEKVSSKEFQELYRIADSMLSIEDCSLLSRQAYAENKAHAMLGKSLKSRQSLEATSSKITACKSIVTNLSTLSQSVHHLRCIYSTDIHRVMNNILPHVLFERQDIKKSFLHRDILNFAPSSDSCASILILATFPHKSETRLQQKIVSSWKRADLSKDSKTSRQLLLLTAGVAQQDSPEVISTTFETIGRILRTGVSINRSHLAVMLRVIQELSHFHNKQDQNYLTTLGIEEAFTLWSFLTIARHQAGAKSLKESPTLIFRLEMLMASIITNANMCSLQPATLMKCIKERGIENVLQIIHGNISADLTDRVENLEMSRYVFICALIAYDASMFAPTAIKVFMNRTSDSGLIIDEVVAIAVREIHCQAHYIPKRFSLYPENIIKVMVNRFCSHFQHLADNRGPHETLDNFLVPLSILILRGEISSSEEINQIQKCSLMLLLNWNDLKTTDISQGTLRTILSFVFKIAPKLSTLPSPSVAQPFQELRNAAISFTARHLSRTINREFSKRDELDTDVELMLSTIFTLLKAGNMCDVPKSSLQKILSFCLTFGMSGEIYSLKYFEIAHLIIASVFDEKKEFVIEPSQIYSMIIDHPQFNVLVTNESKTRTGTLALLICCVALSENRFDVDMGKMKKLLLAYRAGLTPGDRFLRRLFQLCKVKTLLEETASAAGDDSEYVPEFRGVMYGQHWQRFVNDLEPRRVRKTVNYFPRNDPAEYSPIPFIEPGIILKNIPEDCTDIDSKNDNDARGSTPTDTPLLPKADNAISKFDDFSEEEDDDRYSPAFIIPSVLEVMEYFAAEAEKEEVPSLTGDSDTDRMKRPSKSTETKNFKESNHSSPKREMFVKVAHTLFQKGILALSVVTLSSKSKKLRNIAIAVIFHFLQALKLRETHKLTTWRARPQIEMIINSLQRGLVVARAQKMMQTSKQSDNIDGIVTIPMLPAVNALFLGRCLLTLVNPSDDLYGALNKSFLRLVAHHGAYTDFFSLPAFMTLFCSMNDNPDQARKERLWALCLLKDGIVDSYCYRMASRRHVPELLLTSFDALCSKDEHFSHDDECLALLETIQASIQHGGDASFYHYYHAVGILSWVQSSIQANILKSALVSMAFMKTLNVILAKANEEYERLGPQLRSCLDIVKLARSVVDVFRFLASKESYNLEKCVNHNALSQNVKLTSQILWSLCELQTKNVDTPLHPHYLHQNGIPVNICIEIIGAIKVYAPSFLRETVTALCHLPFETSSLKQDKVMLFSHEAVKSIFLTENNSRSGKTLSTKAIINRITDLSSIIQDREGLSRLLILLFGSRQVLVTKHIRCTEWLAYVRTIEKNLDHATYDSDNKTDSLFRNLLEVFDEQNDS